MVEPTRRSSRLALAAGVAAAVTLAGGGFMLGRGTRHEAPVARLPAPAAVPGPAQPPVPEKTVQLPALQSPLGRARLIAAVAAVADSFSSGQPQPSSSALAGERFELRLPFGCAGSAPDSSVEPLRWTYEEAASALRVRAEPVRWAAGEWMTVTAAASPVEAVQGFWIARPWTSGEGCPPPAPPAAVPPPSQTPPVDTLGVAEFFTADSSRLTRREDRPFEAVEKVAPEALNISQGLRLRLRGRITTVPDGRSVVCRTDGPDRRPACLVAVAFDEVAIENPATGETVATWDVSRDSDAKSGSPARD